MKVVRSIAALVFVIAIGLLIGSPVIFNGDEGRVSFQPDVDAPATREPRRAPAAKPKPTTAAPSTSAPSTSERPRLVNSYPRRCLRKAAAPPDDLVATVSGRTLQVTRLDGTVASRTRDPQIKGPVRWSPSGRFLAVGPQGLFWRSDGTQVMFSNGEFGHGMVSLTPEGPWAWSPIADCGIALEDGTLYVSTIDPFVSGTGIALVENGVRTFGFEPDGRVLRFALDGERGELEFFRADLVSGDIRPVDGLTKLGCRTCSPNGDFRVVTRDGRLMLVDRDGNSRGSVGSPQGSSVESDAEWGPEGTGVLFLRSTSAISQVWFLAEGSSQPRYLTEIDRGIRAAPDGVDWSATPPGGRPGG